jgi:hypothetical protein
MVRTFKDWLPLPRLDSTPWEEVILQESTTRDGPWDDIDTITLPVDPDPAHPQPVSFTTDEATLDEGWYRLVFTKDADASTSDPVHFENEVNPDYLPTVDGVAVLIRARTKDRFGNEVGTFNSDTRPTRTQAIEAINHAGNIVMAALGEDPPSETAASAREMVKIRAAMTIELGYFPEQIEADQSPYDRLKDMYDEELERVIKAIDEIGGGGEVGPGDTEKTPKWSFPEAEEAVW